MVWCHRLTCAIQVCENHFDSIINSSCLSSSEHPICFYLFRCKGSATFQVTFLAFALATGVHTIAAQYSVEPTTCTFTNITGHTIENVVAHCYASMLPCVVEALLAWITVCSNVWWKRYQPESLCSTSRPNVHHTLWITVHSFPQIKLWQTNKPWGTDNWTIW